MWLAVPADSLSGLEKVLDLGERGVWVRLVDECVELLHCLPDGHLGTSLGLEVVAGLEVVRDSLLLVLLAVEVLDTVAGILVLAELSLVLVCVELGLLVHVDFFLSGGAVLDTHSGLHDVDLVDSVRGSLQGEAILVVVEVLGHVGRLEHRWCHDEGLY